MSIWRLEESLWQDWRPQTVYYSASSTASRAEAGVAPQSSACTWVQILTRTRNRSGTHVGSSFFETVVTGAPYAYIVAPIDQKKLQYSWLVYHCMISTQTVALILAASTRWARRVAWQIEVVLKEQIWAFRSKYYRLVFLWALYHPFGFRKEHHDISLFPGAQSTLYMCSAE